jgi:hypothetical protein
MMPARKPVGRGARGGAGAALAILFEQADGGQGGGAVDRGDDVVGPGFAAPASRPNQPPMTNSPPVRASGDTSASAATRTVTGPGSSGA